MRRTRATRRAAFHDRPWGEVEHAARNLRNVRNLMLFILVLMLFSLATRDQFLVLSAILTLAAGLAILTVAFRYGRASRLISLRLGLCHACDADLRGIEPEPDGRTPCPRCGAAWKLESHGAGQV